MGYPISGGAFFTFNYHVSTGEEVASPCCAAWKKTTVTINTEGEGKRKGVSLGDST